MDRGRRNVRKRCFMVTAVIHDSCPPGRCSAFAGITQVFAGLLPDTKVDAVRAIETRAKVMLVGDGVNDAPAMAAVLVSIAMGRSGSDLALETADAVITRDDLATLPAIVALARRARRVVTANLIIAATFIAVLVIWDLVGRLSLPLGVAGHEGSTLVVGLNGLRLLRDTAWPKASGSRAARRREAAPTGPEPSGMTPMAGYLARMQKLSYSGRCRGRGRCR